MRPGRKEGSRSDRKEDLQKLWEALKEQPPGHISTIKTPSRKHARGVTSNGKPS